MYGYTVYIIWLLHIVLSAEILYQTLEPKLSRMLSWGIYALFVIAPSIFKKVFFLSKGASPSSTFFYAILTLIYACIVFRDHLILKLIICCLLCIVTATSEGISNYIVVNLLDFQYDQTALNTPSALILVFVSSALSLLFGTLVVALWSKIMKGERFSLTSTVVFCIFPLSQILIVTDLRNPLLILPNYVLVIMFAGMVLCLIADIALFYIQFETAKTHKLEKQLVEAEYLRQLEEVHYTALKKRQMECRELKQHFSHRISDLSLLLNKDSSEEAQSYLEMFQGEWRDTEPVYFCGNSIMNTVLTEKAKLCKMHSIRLETDVSVSEQISIPKNHLCSIMSNMLDNALEACKSLMDIERGVAVKGFINGDYLTIRVQNTYSKLSLYPKSRGYGHKILRDIAAQHNGELMIKTQDNIYTCVIVLELREN